MWIERLALTRFRNHRSVTLTLDPRPAVLIGANGAGKTNILEAVSLLAPGQGLRRAPYAELAQAGGDGSWAVAARVHAQVGLVEIGTGMPAGAPRIAQRASCVSMARISPDQARSARTSRWSG